MFWIYAGISVDNIGDVFVASEQCLHEVKAFLFLPSPLQGGGWGAL